MSLKHPFPVGVWTLVLAGVALAAQAPRPLFSTGTDLVVLHATVKDRRGAYVSGLPKEAFSVLEGAQPQTISLFTSDDAPVTVGLLVDNSGSMQPHRDRVIAAATAFAESSNPQDELFALAFDEDVRAALPMSAPFTSDIRTLREALTHALSTRGRTALFDAITTGLNYLRQGHQERKVLVLVSDGGDNASRTTFADVMRRTQSSNVLIYTVGLMDPIERDSNPRVLKRIAEASGGEAFMPRDVQQITDVLRHIARDIRHTYTIGYVSSNPVRDGRFRTVRLAVQPPDGRRVIVRTRGGYLAGLSQAGSDDGR